MTQPGNNTFNGQWSQLATLKTRSKTCLRRSFNLPLCYFRIVIYVNVTKRIVIYNSALAPKCPIKALFVAKNGVGDRNITIVRYVAHFSEHASLCEVKY